MGSVSLQRNRAGAPQAARIGRLAKLPVFWALDGRRVLLAGGSDGAAWKAELLAACGAEVHVFAPSMEVGAAMAALLAMAPSDEAGRFVHHDTRWNEAHFKSFAMAVGDCEEGAEADAFVAAARGAGVPVNVIDKPAHCQFQFGAIVNRSPVVIGISTDGAAPVLAQAIRRRVEAVLPPALKGWAALAQSVRAAVNERFPPGTARRLFWEQFTDRAFSGEPAPDAVNINDDNGAVGSSLSIVPLAGPDPELLTLKAVRMLQSADLILYDDAVPAAILELGRREACRLPAPARLTPDALLPAERSGHVVWLVSDEAPARRIDAAGRMAERLGFTVSVLPRVVIHEARTPSLNRLHAGLGEAAASVA